MTTRVVAIMRQTGGVVDIANSGSGSGSGLVLVMVMIVVIVIALLRLWF